LGGPGKVRHRGRGSVHKSVGGLEGVRPIFGGPGNRPAGDGTGR